MAKMVEVKCKNCRKKFEARSADVKRGWGKFCSKSCKAKEQEKRTGQYAKYLDRKTPTDEECYDRETHIFSSEGLGQE